MPLPQENLKSQMAQWHKFNGEYLRNNYDLIVFDTEGVLKKKINKTIAKYSAHFDGKVD